MSIQTTGKRPPQFSDWTDERYQELLANQQNGRVGTILVSETDKVRVWHLSIAPGERLPFHRHVMDYFWTALTAGRARSHYGDGSVLEAVAAGASMIHDLENIGDGTLVFVTVERKDSANSPLAVLT